MLINIFILLRLLHLFIGFSTNTNAESNSEEYSDDYVPRFFGGQMSDQDTPTFQRGWKGILSLPSVKVLNFTQKLDHFAFKSKSVWNQRYFVNDAFFKPRPNGPIFIIIGGENRMSPRQVTDGPMVRLAMKYEALVLGLEHRFYGDSRPTNDTSVKNLRYLSSQQALADLHNFIKNQMGKYQSENPKARIVLYGCSYAGSLAAYFTERYPDIKAKAIAGFAPMVAIENFSQYFEGVNRALYVHDESNVEQIGVDRACHSSLAAAFGHIAELVRKGDDVKLNAALNLCEPKVLNYSNPNAIDSLTYETLSILMEKAQYNNVQFGKRSALSSLCSIMTQKDYYCQCNNVRTEIFSMRRSLDIPVYRWQSCCDVSDQMILLKNEQLGSSISFFQLERYVSWLSKVDATCIIHNGAGIAVKNEAWDRKYVEQGKRQWMWQMCTEWGYFTPTPDNLFYKSGLEISLEYADTYKMRHASASYIKKTCKESFKILNTTEYIMKTNKFYGKYSGKERFDNVYFLVSWADPWFYAFNEFKQRSAGGYTLMQTISHCNEPRGNDSDPKELSDAWTDIDNTIQGWFDGKTFRRTWTKYMQW